MTPLFLALVLIEIADLVFAVDSVPAVFAITTDPYIVYTSNIFAILGLRALYFALAAVLHRFHYLKYALAILLVFIGSKIFVADAFGWEKFPASWSLGITFAILAAGVVYSLWRSRNEPAACRRLDRQARRLIRRKASHMGLPRGTGPGQRHFRTGRAVSRARRDPWLVSAIRSMSKSKDHDTAAP